METFFQSAVNAAAGVEDAGCQEVERNQASISHDLSTLSIAQVIPQDNAFRGCFLYVVMINPSAPPVIRIWMAACISYDNRRRLSFIRSSVHERSHALRKSVME